MDLERLNRWLALAANTGVLIGILFLAAEIQQSNRIAKATTEIELRNAYGVLNAAIYSEESGVAALFVKAQSPDAALTPEETVRMRAWLTQAVNQWVAIEQAYLNELAPEATLGVVFDDQAVFIGSYPAFRPILRGIVTDYRAIEEMEVIRSLDARLSEKGA